MKKKLVTGALLCAFGAVAVTGGTLAYFTDTDNATNEFTVGNVQIDLIEKNADGTDFTQNQLLMPGSKTVNNVAKVVTVENTGDNAAYCWIEVWVPASLDDGDDNSPAAPGLGNSLHFNYGADVTETKATYLGNKDGYNGYVHYVAGSNPTAKNASTVALLDQVYMDSKVTQCEEHDNCLVLMDGQTHYTGDWNLKINAVGFQSEGFDSIEKAITEYYGKDVTQHIW